MADSFQGGVDPRRAGRGEIRARVAVQGSNVEALTGDETFRIPVGRCTLSRDGRRIVVRDEQAPLVIWSDDDAFLEVLERAQRGTLRDQVSDIRSAERRRRVIRVVARSLLAMAALYVACIPLTGWALRGGVPALSNRVGQSALQHLGLPSGQAPIAERRLGMIADQLRPAVSPDTRSFRLLLADYGDAHSFNLPPDVVIVTAGLVCGAENPETVTEIVARELGHLENRDVSLRVAEDVDWYTPVDFVVGGAGQLRDRMLDFADPKRSPGFTPAQETAADDRAAAMLERAGVPAASAQSTTLAAQLQQIHGDTAPAAPAPPATGDDALDWAKVRADACNVIGR